MNCHFCGFYRCTNPGESLTNLTYSPSGFTQFVNDSPEFTHRQNPQKICSTAFKLWEFDEYFCLQKSCGLLFFVLELPFLAGVTRQHKL